MKTNNELINDYSDHLKKGEIQKSYKLLLDILIKMRSHLIKTHPNLIVGRFNQGFMDFSYFSFTSETLKERKLKVALLFNHQKVSYELWLVGLNKKALITNWELFNKKGFNKFSIEPTAKEAIIIKPILKRPDFDDLINLNNQLESKSIEFIDDIESFIDKFE